MQYHHDHSSRLEVLFRQPLQVDNGRWLMTEITEFGMSRVGAWFNKTDFSEAPETYEDCVTDWFHYLASLATMKTVPQYSEQRFLETSGELKPIAGFIVLTVPFSMYIPTTETEFNLNTTTQILEHLNKVRGRLIF